MEEQKPVVVKPSVKEKAAKQIEALKAQIVVLKAKNAELMEKLTFEVTKLKVQAKELQERLANTKPVIASKSLYVKTKNFISGVRIVPVKHIICFKQGDELLYLHGYVLDTKRGCFVVREPKLVDYKIKDDSFFVVREADRPFLVPGGNVQFIVAAPM